MQCSQAHEALSSLLDGENAAVHREAAAHVAECPLCAERTREYRRIGEQLRAAGRIAPPSDLAARISARLAAEARGADTTRYNWRQIARQAAALILVAGLSGFVSWHLAQSSAREHALERDIVTAHARSLLQDSTVQVASSETHTVKPWFNGRIEFAPAVKDLTAQGFPLVGGRLDFVAGHRAAALVYKRRLHVINVFVWPAAAAAASTPPQLAVVQGYNVVSWTSGGLTCWAVSDLNVAELAELQALL